MRILGINKHHNSSACVFKNEELIYFNQEERLSRVKKDTGFPYFSVQEALKICPEIDALVLTGYDHVQSENHSVVHIVNKMGFKFSKIFQVYSYNKGHHLSHAANAFYNSGFDNSLVIVWDGKGSTFNLTNGGQAHETRTVFKASNPNSFHAIYKRFHTFSKITPDTNIIWNNSFGVTKEAWPRWHLRSSEIEIRNDYDLGLMYEGMSRSLNFVDEGGKMLGLQSYGKYNPEIPWIMAENYKFNMDLFTFDAMHQHTGFNFSAYPEFVNHKEKLVDLAFATQKALEGAGLDFILKMLEKTGEKNLILTGGVALNVVANNYFKKNLPSNINLYVEPMCGDEGNIIGTVKYFLRERSATTKIKPLTNIYLCGNEPTYEFTLADDEILYENVTEEIVTEILLQQSIVAMFQGKAESGPRALGNRSILFDPRNTNGKNIVNTVKGREEFRPFAATVLHEHVNDWFEMNGIAESPYMMFAVDAKDGVKDRVPSVIHVDNTCRVQTLKEEQNPNFYKLISAFFKRTGVPMLFNTSFNLGDEPIVETLENAFASCRRSGINYLYLPEVKKLIYFDKTKKIHQTQLTKEYLIPSNTGSTR
jgi:carbamoyltransferase